MSWRDNADTSFKEKTDMAKKRQPKARTNNNRAGSFPRRPADPKQLEDDFRHLYDSIWTGLISQSPGDRDNVSMMQAVLGASQVGWNIAIHCKTPYDIEMVVSELATRSNSDFEGPTMSLVLIAANLKLTLFPDDIATIKDAGITVIKGNPQVWVEFLWEATEPE